MVKTGQTRTQERKSTQKARRKLSKSNQVNPQSTLGQSHNKTKSKIPIQSLKISKDTLDDEKAQERWDFTLLTLTKKEQGVSITDCHAGNPCEISSDLTDENDLPMIGRLYGYDQEEV
ncbi:hypothetical protein Tco_1512707 [Tanacetum coccineum]